MLVTINVTQEDIDQGCGSNWKTCMVARAVNRVVDLNYWTGVEDTITLYDKSSNQVFSEPIFKDNLEDWVLDKINQFDNWKRSPDIFSEPTSFSFELDIPVQYLKMEVPEGLVLA